MLDNATIVKTFDLGPESEIGKYIRRFRNAADFPSKPLNIRYEKDSFSTFSGISISKGDFSEESEKIHTNLVARDQTIIEFDNHITKGFQRNQLAIANLLNLEFLFDDKDVEDFSINRYFGFYVNPVSEGTETITELISLDNNRTQLNLENTIYSNQDLNDLASIYYMRDKNNKFYKIDADSNWDSNQIIINEKLTEDDFSLLGFSNPIFNADALENENTGYAYIEIEVTDNPRSGDFYYLGEESEDYLIIADHLIAQEGTNDENRFCIFGTNEEVAESMVKAINYNYELNGAIRAIQRENRVIVYSIFSGSRFNSFTVNRNKEIFNNVIEIFSDDGNFIGGTDIFGNRVSIDISYQDILNTDIEDYFVNTVNGFQPVNIFRFLDRPVTDSSGLVIDFVDDDRFITLQTSVNEIIRSSSGTVSVYTRNKNEYGFLSIFPVKDFDFDFHSTEYSSNDNSEMIEYYDGLSYNAVPLGSTNLSDTSAGNFGNLLKYDYDNTFKPFGNFTNILGLENENGELSSIDSEYDRLQENLLADLSTYSRLSPFVCKWVKEGKNVKELPYRLNTNYAFGLDNFSPSFEIKTPNPQYFTHEWYYLGAYPEYIDQSNESVKNYYQFFENNFDLTQYLDPNRDYFSEYFTIEEKGEFDINTEFKFSTFNNGSQRKFADTFFRGAKLYVKNRRENDINLNFNIENIEFLQDAEYNNYKFSAVLQPTTHNYTVNYDGGDTADVNGEGLPLDNPGESIPKLKFTVIENKKFKNIVFLIEFKLPKSNLFRFFLDSIFLYSFKSIKLIKFNNSSSYNNFSSESDFASAIENGDFDFVYPDTPLTGIYDVRGEFDDNKYQGEFYLNTRKITGLRSLQNTFTEALKEITLNPAGIRNGIKLINKGDNTHIYEINDILKVVSNRVLFADSVGRRDRSYEDNDQRIDFANFAALNLYPYYKEGGYNFFERQIQDASFANIFELINQGSPEVEYVTIPEDYNGEVPFESLERNNFALEFEQPFSIQKLKYLATQADTDIPPGLTTETNIGFSLSRDAVTELLPMNRYGGSFMPKFNDVILFTDKNSTSESLKNLNREFDIMDPKFGYIDNFYYSKVSPEAFNRILTVNPETGFSSRYPLIGEIGIDKKDFYIFQSNWDLGYFQKNIDKTQTEEKFGTWNTLENKSFLSSKIMKIPEQLYIEDFIAKEVTDTVTEIFDIEYERTNEQTITMDVLLEQRIISYLFELGIADVFDKYVNYDYTLQKDRELFISQYIKENILPRYVINSVTFWVKSELGEINLPIVNNNLSDSDKRRLEYRQSTNFNFNTKRNSNFDFTLSGSLNSSRFNGFSTAISVEILKR